MRFAISLLTIIAVASVIGTVMKQNEPYANYLNQFGPFWFPLFERVGLYSVYNAWWFLLILAFLVTSTSLCVTRNGPKMLREVVRFRDHVHERSLANLAHTTLYSSALAPAVLVERLSAYLERERFQFRISEKAGGGTLIAAKAGLYRRIGYILTHSAIVLICIGGLADSAMPLKLQVMLGIKRPVVGNMQIADVPVEARLSPDSWNFRGNTLIAEGRSSDIAVLNYGEGVLLQQLPYILSLKKFHIEHYSTGAPKLFASDVLVTDKESGESFEARIEVNRPLVYKGIAAYQASFDDGGTLVRIALRNLLAGHGVMREIEARVGDSLELKFGDSSYGVELSAFRPFNVESLSAAEVRPERSGVDRLREQFGSAAPSRGRDLRNVGPSFQYKLRDAAGQAREYHNYMLPLEFDGRWYLMSGMRENPNDAFRFLRIPLDDTASLDAFMSMRASLFDQGLRAEAGRRFALVSAGTNGGPAGADGGAASAAMQRRLAETAERVLETFSIRGFQAVADFLEASVPEAEREKAAEIYVRVLQGAAWEAWMLRREKQGQPRLTPDALNARFVQDSLNAVSDAFFYGVPVYFSMTGYDEVKASVFQLTRSPGKSIVYWGCALLVLGIFAMFYIRERRVWLLVKPDGDVRLALASNRRSMNIDHEFERHKAAIERLIT